MRVLWLTIGAFTLTALISILLVLTPASGHTVLVESFSKSSCPDCAQANADFKSIYYEEEYDFVYATFVTNKVDASMERMNYYKPFEKYYPTVVNDGGHIIREGGKTKEKYEEDISDTSDRNVANVTFKVLISQIDDDSIKVKVRARLEEGDPITVRIIGYIVEPMSRYMDNNDKPYRFGMLDIAINTTVELEKGAWWSNTTNWHGSDHTDSKGDDFSDIDYSNINVVAGVFIEEEGSATRAVQAGIAVPPRLSILTESGNVTGQVDISCRANANSTSGRTVSSVSYRVDGGAWVDLDHQGGKDYSRTWNSTDVANGTHEITFRVLDDAGTQMRSSIKLNVTNSDYSPPIVSIMEPSVVTVKGTVKVLVNATDENHIDAEISLDGGAGTPMAREEANFTYSINTTNLAEGEHWIWVFVDDGTFVVVAKRRFTVDNDEDPEITSVTPAELTRTAGSVMINATVIDNDTPFSVHLDHNGTIDPLQLKSSNGSIFNYSGVWSSSDHPDGQTNITVVAIDQKGQSTEFSLSLVIDNTPPDAPRQLDVNWTGAWTANWTNVSALDVAHYYVFRSKNPEDLEPGPSGVISLVPLLIIDKDVELTAEIPDKGCPCYIAVVAVDDLGNSGPPITTYVGNPPILRVKLTLPRRNIEKDSYVNIIINITNIGDAKPVEGQVKAFINTEKILDRSVNNLDPNESIEFTVSWFIDEEKVLQINLVYDGRNQTTHANMTLLNEPRETVTTSILLISTGAYASIIVIALFIYRKGRPRKGRRS